MSIETVMPSNHLILCGPALLWPSIFPSIMVFSNELTLRWPKFWRFSSSIIPSNKYSGLVSFRIDWFDLLAGQGLSRVFSSTRIQKYQFFSAQPSLWYNSDTHTWLLRKPQLWLNGPLAEMIYFFFNMLCRFGITFLSRSSYHPQWFWSPRKENLSLLSFSSLLFATKCWDRILWS